MSLYYALPVKSDWLTIKFNKMCRRHCRVQKQNPHCAKGLRATTTLERCLDVVQLRIGSPLTGTTHIILFIYCYIVVHSNRL